MYAALFLLYVVVEIAALVLVGNAIGVLWTVLLLLGGTLIGLLLMRSQWRRVMDGLRRAASGDGSPGAAVADGALVALGSALMFVPGLVTSVLGLLFLVPHPVGTSARRGPAGRQACRHRRGRGGGVRPGAPTRSRRGDRRGGGRRGLRGRSDRRGAPNPDP